MTNPPDVIALASLDDYLRTYGDALLVHATIISADPHTAQDVVQAVLERAYRQWNRICGRSPGHGPAHPFDVRPGQ